MYIEPIGQPWLQHAQLCSVIRGLFENNQTPEKFLPVAKLKEKKSGMEVWNQFKTFAAHHNAKLK